MLHTTTSSSLLLSAGVVATAAECGAWCMLQQKQAARASCWAVTIVALAPYCCRHPHTVTAAVGTGVPCNTKHLTARGKELIQSVLGAFVRVLSSAGAFLAAATLLLLRRRRQQGQQQLGKDMFDPETKLQPYPSPIMYSFTRTNTDLRPPGSGLDSASDVHSTHAKFQNGRRRSVPGCVCLAHCGCAGVRGEGALGRCTYPDTDSLRCLRAVFRNARRCCHHSKDGCVC